MDRPSIQWVVEEAARAGVTEVVVVVDPDGGAIIERHFEESRFLPGLSGVKVRAVVQEEAKGLGHAVLAGREAIGLRPFFVMLADDLIHPHQDLLSPLARAAGPKKSVVYVRRLPDQMLGAKGVVAPSSALSGSVMEIGGAVEKPGVARAPSDYAIHGRYLFMPDVFDHLAGVAPGYGGEIQLTDAVDSLARAGRCRAYVADVELLDVGNPLGYLRANTVLGLADPAYGEPYRSVIPDLLVE